MPLVPDSRRSTSRVKSTSAQPALNAMHLFLPSLPTGMAGPPRADPTAKVCWRRGPLQISTKAHHKDRDLPSAELDLYVTCEVDPIPAECPFISLARNSFPFNALNHSIELLCVGSNLSF
jgi:hypothetical protein